MEILELQHILSYPNLQCLRYYKGKSDNRIQNIVGHIRENEKDFIFIQDAEYKGTAYKVQLKCIKPILRPLSDLTKEIEIEGKKFVPSDIIDSNCLRWLLVSDISEIKLHTYNKLLEWHFDVFGLIGKGLAINMNTLKTTTHDESI